MISSRRLARELALRALYQVDVGKQPLSEALEGSLSRIRVALTDPAIQQAIEFDRETKLLIRDHAPRASVPGARQFRRLARSASQEMSRFSDSISEYVQEVIPPLPGMAWETTIVRVESAVQIHLDGLLRLARRLEVAESSYKTVIERARVSFGIVIDILTKLLPFAVGPAEYLVACTEGVVSNRDELDCRLGAIARDWTMDRLSAVDRNILRLAAFEILYLPSVPIGVSIDQAVKLAKKYSSPESGKFVNGILGALADEVGEKPQASQDPLDDAVEALDISLLE